MDDTLYSWIGFFVPAFYAMVEELVKITGIDESVLLQEYKEVHQSKHNVEHPFSTLQLPSIRAIYPNLSSDEIRNGPLREAFHRFNSERKHRLALYPGVSEMLIDLVNAGVKVVGFTDSFEENGYYRLVRLGIEKFFTKVYVYDRQYEAQNIYDTPQKVIHIGRKKPDPKVLNDICAKESIEKESAIYMGDSMTKDIYMACCAGIDSIWVHKKVDGELYKKLVDVSHWTEDEFKSDLEIKKEIEKRNVAPTYTISDLSEVSNIVLYDNTSDKLS